VAETAAARSFGGDLERRKNAGHSFFRAVANSGVH
jgi:hypothetical protein